MSNNLQIIGAKALFPGGVWDDNARIAIADGQYISPDQQTAALTIQADGLLALPGIVDLHGDAFERQLMPRPGVHFSHAAALIETDNQMIANGITTAYHGLTFSWEPGLRGAESARQFVDALQAIRPRLMVDTCLHLRYETYNLDAEPQITEWIQTGKVDMLAFNDHMLHIEKQISKPEKLATYAGRTGLTTESFIALLQRIKGRANEVPLAIERLASTARQYRIPMASHDDESPEDRAWFEKIGCTICEFPVDGATARYAMQRGNPVIMGGPNILRGGSHCGRLSAAEAIRDGTANILTSDYYYPSLLLAAFKLVTDGVCELSTAWASVSTNPARAVKKNDRDEIAIGKRADMILVDNSDPDLPVVRAAIVAGKLVYTKDIADRFMRCNTTD